MTQNSTELDHPLPKFRIGQRVSTTWIDGDTGEANCEEGVIFGYSYCSENSDRYGRKGWTYYLHFDVPRVLDDEADEADLTAIER